MSAISLSDIQTQALRVLLGTRAYSSGGLAIATTKTRVQNATAINYSINGQVYAKAATDNLFIHQDLTVQAANTTKWYGLFLDASGNGTIYAGDSTSLPAIPMTDGVPTKCLVGAIKVVTGAATFTPATTNHDAANVTTTYYNLSCAPVGGVPA